MEEENPNIKGQKEESSYHLSDDDIGDEDGEAAENSDNKLLGGDKMISINLLDYRKLSKIKKDFKLKEEGLLKDQFINIMLHHLPEIKDKVGLVNSLNELFAEIDVNDDKHLEWDEFSNYIIEIGLVRKEQGFVDVIKNYKQSEWRDTIKHDNDIEYLNYFPHTKTLIVMERDNKRFKIYNMKNGKFEKEVKGHTGAVISAYHIHERNLLATSSNDLSIIMWDDSSYTMMQKINSPIIPIVLMYYENILYAGGPEGMIYYWNLQDNSSRIPQSNLLPKPKDFNHGNKAVTAMIMISKLNILATSDLDGQILLWNFPLHTPNRKMTKLSKGIYALDWSDSVGCLFSAGLDRAAYVWNPYVNKHIYKLSGHIHSLVGIKCVPDTHQLITADISGMFKVWDIRTFTCIQSFNVPIAELNAFAVTFPEKKIIAGAKRLHMYTYEEPKDQNKADEGIPLMVLYNSLYNTFITAHPSCVKIWNCSNGKLVRVFRNLTQDDITTIQLDNKKRKLFLGDSKGRVLTFKVKNGSKIKKFKKHGGEVTSLIFWSDSKYLISSSWDHKVHVHDDSQGGEKGSIRFDQIKHRGIVNSIDMKEEGKQLASCSDDGTILITNLRTLRQETEFIGHEGEVKALKFLNPHNCLVATDLMGFFYFWGVSPSNMKNTLLLKIPNKVTKDTGGTDTCPVRALDWDNLTSTLYCGDDLGNIHAWNISILLQKLNKFGKKTDESDSDGKQGFSKYLITLLAPNSDFAPKKIVADDMKKIIEWKAHEEGIIHITLLEGLNYIASTSFDYRVHIWDLKGNRMGTLIVGDDPNWNVKIDTQPRLDALRKEAMCLFEESKLKSYEKIIDELSFMAGPGSDSDDSDEEVDKTKSIFAKLDMSFPVKDKSPLPRAQPRSAKETINKAVNNSSNKALNNSRIETQSSRIVPPRRSLSNLGKRIISRK
ncbi:hypothetical protein SteCoe_14603 [Stentor coeruleus]|uniref:EF-hand domain-containing protein n=1 Tax=Stentor coeruleus TaxID=5963 RepID=A0A1R2C5Q2_9CILI|nr:hypothetical protein SteCoe_14603 [Stentor coeruleus]